MPYFVTAVMVDFEVACIHNHDDILVLTGMAAASDASLAEILAPDVGAVAASRHPVVEEQRHHVFLSCDR